MSLVDKGANDFMFKYKTVDGVVTILGFKNKCFSENLVIPEFINGNPVHYVAAGAFRGLPIKSLVANSILSVKDYAFNQCELENIELLNCLFVGDNSFSNNSLRSIFLPACKEIMFQSFAGNLIRSVDVGLCKKFGVGAFYDNHIELLNSPACETYADNCFARNKLNTVVLKSGCQTGVSSFDDGVRLVNGGSKGVVVNRFVALYKRSPKRLGDILVFRVNHPRRLAQDYFVAEHRGFVAVGGFLKEAVLNLRNMLQTG